MRPRTACNTTNNVINQLNHFHGASYGLQYYQLNNQSIKSFPCGLVQSCNITGTNSTKSINSTVYMQSRTAGNITNNVINQLNPFQVASNRGQHHQHSIQSIHPISSIFPQSFAFPSWIRKSGPTALTNITTSQSIKPFQCDLGLYSLQYHPVFRIQIRTDPHKEMSPGSGSAWTDANPDPGGKKAFKKYRFIR